jgi:hypothetical protein
MVVLLAGMPSGWFRLGMVKPERLFVIASLPYTVPRRMIFYNILKNMQLYTWWRDTALGWIDAVVQHGTATGGAGLASLSRNMWEKRGK